MSLLLGEILDRNCQTHPHKVAATLGDESLSFAQVDQAANRSPLSSPSRRRTWPPAIVARKLAVPTYRRLSLAPGAGRSSFQSHLTAPQREADTFRLGEP